MRFQEEDENVKSLRKTHDGRRTKTDGNSSGELKRGKALSCLKLTVSTVPVFGGQPGIESHEVV